VRVQALADILSLGYIANPSNSAQLGALYHSPKLHLGPCSSVVMQPRTDTQTCMITMHFVSSTTHTKCN